MKKTKSKVVGFAVFAVAFSVWGWLFSSCRENNAVVFPAGGFEIYTLTDNEAGGFSTSELSVSDSLAAAHINIRSGKAFPYAGMGFNLMSVNGRPAGYYDLSKFDSLSIVVTAGRMRSISLRLLTDDPIYSKPGMYLSYRPLECSLPVTNSYSEIKTSLAAFKTAEWWLASQGLENDDGLTYFYRTTLFEVYNGEGALRGIPDDIEVKQIRLWGVNRDFEKGMYFAAAFMVALLGVFAYLVFRKPNDKELLKKQMSEVARLLKSTDKSLAEIAIAVGAKSQSKMERNFYKVYGKKALDYRRKNV